jgi:hypothetical protein
MDTAGSCQSAKHTLDQRETEQLDSIQIEFSFIQLPHSAQIVINLSPQPIEPAQLIKGQFAVQIRRFGLTAMLVTDC